MKMSYEDALDLSLTNRLRSHELMLRCLSTIKHHALWSVSQKKKNKKKKKNYNTNNNNKNGKA
jgi:hypothetical protein